MRDLILIICLIVGACFCVPAQTSPLSKDPACYVIKRLTPYQSKPISGNVELEKFAVYDICITEKTNETRTILLIKEEVKKSVEGKLIRIFDNKAEAKNFALKNKITKTPFSAAAITDCQIIRDMDMPVFSPPLEQTQEIALIDTCTMLESPYQFLPKIKVIRSGKSIERDFWHMLYFKDKAEAAKYAKQHNLRDVELARDTTEIVRIDNELTSDFLAMRKEANAKKRVKLADDFREKLLEKLKNPVTFKGQLTKLSRLITIRRSDDRQVKFYSLDNKTGGVKRTFTVITQFQSYQETYAHVLDYSYKTDYRIDKIYEFKSHWAWKTCYLVFGWGTNGDGRQFDVVKIFELPDHIFPHWQYLRELSGGPFIRSPYIYYPLGVNQVCLLMRKH